jgi:hypothetical protein
MKTKGLWRTLDRFAVPATVLTEWRMVLDGEFADAEPFLRVTQELAEGYPCTHPTPCGCQHEVVVHAPDRIVAACRCDERECPSIRLEPTDLLIHGLNFKKLCGALARAFRFEPAPASAEPFPGAPRAWPVGVFLRTHSPVYFCACPTDESLLINIEGLITAQREPFILLVPTELHRSAAAQSLLQRQRCELIPLARFLSFAGKGQFMAADSIQPVLDRFAAGCVPHGQSISPVLEGIHRAITAGHDERRELREAKARLELMQGENLFKFVQKVDDRAFRIVCAVLVHGDVAKAARALSESDSTLRDFMGTWKKRGGAYIGLLEIVKWRKRRHLGGTVPFNDALLYDKGTEGKRENVLKDVLDGLLSMTEGNWPDICAELENLLREQLGQSDSS